MDTRGRSCASPLARCGAQRRQVFLPYGIMGGTRRKTVYDDIRRAKARHIKNRKALNPSFHIASVLQLELSPTQYRKTLGLRQPRNKKRKLFPGKALQTLSEEMAKSAWSKNAWWRIQWPPVAFTPSTARSVIDELGDINPTTSLYTTVQAVDSYLRGEDDLLHFNVRVTGLYKGGGLYESPYNLEPVRVDPLTGHIAPTAAGSAPGAP